MYEFIQTDTGWQIFWGPPLPMAEVVEITEVTEETQEAEGSREVIARRRATERRPVHRAAPRRRGMLATN